jgi:hypothetical protein
MTYYDECLLTMHPHVALEIENLTLNAGTSDADWSILEQAGTEIYALRQLLNEYITASSTFDMESWLRRVRAVTEDYFHETRNR